MKVLFGVMMVVSLSFFPAWVQAAGQYDVSIGSEDVSFSPSVPLVEQNNKIYLTIQNDGARDVEGVVSFFDGTTLIGSKPFSVRASARPEEVWMNWRPVVLGTHQVKIVVENEEGLTDARPENNQLTISVLVDRDSDGDSVPDSQDQDRDNDGLLNTDEQISGTNPDRRDTDGDGVDDRRDVYPLDAKRSVREAPRPVAPTTTRVTSVPAPRVPAPTPSVQTTTAPSRPVVSSSTPSVIEIGMTSSSASTTIADSLSSDDSTMIDPVAVPEVKQSIPQEEESPVSRALVAAAAVTGVLALGFVWLSYRRD